MSQEFVTAYISYGQTQSALRARLVELHKKISSWRKIAKLPEYSKIGVPAGTLNTIAKTGYIPKKWKKKLKVINDSLPYTNKRNANLNSKARMGGWKNLSEYLTAVNNDEIEIPKRRASQ